MGASRIVGILGGMGPAATVDFYDKLVRATPAQLDQDHLRVVIWADPTVPNRHAALNGDGEDPSPWLAQGVRRLEEAGAELIVVPCNTAHAFLPAIAADAGVEFLSIIDTAVDEVVAADHGPRTGILAAEGAVRSGLYQAALTTVDREPILPPPGHQTELMEVIDRVKSGDAAGQDVDRLSAILSTLSSAGATSAIVGCTELSVLIPDVRTDLHLIDASRALARRTVALCARPDDA